MEETVTSFSDREQYDKLVPITAIYTCTLGHQLLVAWIRGKWRLRCKCGEDPQIKQRNVRSLRRIYEEEGIEALGAIARMTLSRQLFAAIRKAESKGKFNTKYHQLSQKLEAEMTGNTKGELDEILSYLQGSPE